MKILKHSEDWILLAKGNANYVYQYNGSDSSLSDKVLRLRMKNQTITTEQVYKFMTETMCHMLPEVVSVELVQVEFMKEGALNEGFGLLMPKILKNMENVKKGNYFAAYSTELDDMSVLEIKPKWLIETSYGCRNCIHHRHKHGVEPLFCSRDLTDRRKIHDVSLKLAHHSTNVQIALEEYLLSENNVFHRIMKLQDPEFTMNGIYSLRDVTEDHCLQMTLRDVTVFLRFDGSSFIEAVVTDVDPKSPLKWDKWVKTEHQLTKRSLG